MSYIASPNSTISLYLILLMLCKSMYIIYTYIYAFPVIIYDETACNYKVWSAYTVPDSEVSNPED